MNRKHRLLVCCALAIGAGGTFAEAPPHPEFSDAAVQRILAHGPWPPLRTPDPSNRVSGSPAAIAFGAALFDDRRLSPAGTMACSDCHQPARAFTDGLARAIGRPPLDRNTPTLTNVGGQRWYGWDGGNDNLWAQSLRPLLDANEMAGSVGHLASTVRGADDLTRGYARAFARAPPLDDETLAVDVAKALAAYQETLVTRATPFDEFRAALARGDEAAAARYPAAARRGLAIFVGEGNCSFCHSGPNFSNGEFHDVGIPFFAAPGRVDPGRHQGIGDLRASRYNLLGPFNDDPQRTTATSTRHVALEHRNYGEFKVPSLRNVARTAPYMHNGSLASLRDVVRHYSNLDENRLHADGERILKPLRLDKYSVDDLVAFLESLSEPVAPLPAPAPK